MQQTRPDPVMTLQRLAELLPHVEGASVIIGDVSLPLDRETLYRWVAAMVAQGATHLRAKYRHGWLGIYGDAATPLTNDPSVST